MKREQRYAELVRKRKECKKCHKRCPHLTNPAEVESGNLDSEEIGPYSTWQANLDAEILIVAKDFAPVSVFVELEGRPGAKVRTNQNLSRSLERAGYPIGTPDNPLPNSQVFLTNAVLCLAGGDSMRTSIPHSAIKACSNEFLHPLIELISPRFIATLGRQATDAVIEGLGISNMPKFRKLIKAGEGITVNSVSTLYAMPHPAASFPRAVHEAAWKRLTSSTAKLRDNVNRKTALPPFAVSRGSLP